MMNDQIFINGKFLCSQVTGVQRYALELFQQMDELLAEPVYKGLRLTCLVPRKILSKPNWQRIEIRQIGLSSANIWEQFDLPFYARGKLLFSPANTGPIFYPQQVITFHDANIFAVPEAYSVSFRIKYWLIFNILARIARNVITDSQFSQWELAKFLGISRERFQVISLGGDHLNAVEADASILARHGLAAGTYLLAVASQSKHKNFSGVFHALKSNDIDVEFAVVGGSQSKIFQKSFKDTSETKIKLLGYVSDSELKALYENALCFIFPSLYEGFGLPVLEAMNSGCPVLCSSAASLPEVGGQAALYFNPHDFQEIAAAIKRILFEPDLKIELKLSGFVQAAKFTWEKAARETLNVLVECLQRGSV